MKLKTNIINYLFTRNPAIISINGQGVINVSVAKPQSYSGAVYRGRFSLPINIDFSDVFDSLATNIAETGKVITPGLLQLESNNAFAARQILVSIQGAVSTSYDVKAFPGGVSVQNLKHYASLDSDVFAERFLKRNSNFFLTTRTSGNRIVMKETELAPLVFINQTDLATLKVSTDDPNAYLYVRGLEPGIYALDIEALRRVFALEYGRLVSVFNINGNDTQILIERAAAATERYRLKFRNSFGVFEIIELPGRIEVENEFDDENSIYKVFDHTTGHYATERRRISLKRTLSIETGSKRAEEIRFMADMLASDEVYLLDLTPYPIRVIPSVENLNHPHRITTPQNFKLKLELTENNTDIMEDIILNLNKTHIFTKEFSNQFI